MDYRFMDMGTACVAVAKAVVDTLSDMFSPADIAGAVMISDTGQGMCSIIIEHLMPVGWGLLLIVFCLDLMQKTYQDTFTVQQLIGPFCKLVAGVIAISMCAHLAQGLCELANGITSVVADAANNTYQATIGKEFLYQEINNSKIMESVSAISGVKGVIAETGADFAVNIFGGVLFIVYMLPAMLACKALEIYLTITCLYRSIEFWLRCSFLPIACADLLHNGTQSSGMKYCKSILAVGTQGAMIVGLFGICMGVSQSIYQGGWKFFKGGAVSLWIIVTCLLCFFGISSAKAISRDVFN